MNDSTIITEEKKGFLTIHLNCPDKKNAFNPQMIEELKGALKSARKKPIRCVGLVGEGDTFCGGADLNWMKQSLNYNHEENIRDTENLYELFEMLDTYPLPVLACVQRFVLGGAIGLISACDYVIAVEGTQFSFSEVKMGLIPACIGPFILKKLGESWTRAMFLSAERFDVSKAINMGLVHERAPDLNRGLQNLQQVAEQIAECSPEALAVAKTFLGKIKQQSPEKQKKLAIETLANIRVTPAAQEGLQAFLEKRAPNWTKNK